MDWRRIGAVIFIMIGIIVLIIGLIYQLFDFRSVSSTITTVLIGSMFIAGTYLFKPNTRKNEESNQKRIIPSSKEPEFIAKRVNGQKRYIRGSVNIVFHSEYTGKLTNGYFVNEIIFPQNNGMNSFSHTINHLSEDSQSAKSSV